MYSSSWRPTLASATSLLLILFGACLLPARPAAASSISVAASGLDNPRGLTFGPDGALWITEAGRGGAGPCIDAADPGQQMCVGASGAVTRVAGGHQTRVATGLSSLIPTAGQQAGAEGPASL